MIPIEHLESTFWAAVTAVVWLGLAVLAGAILWLLLRWAGPAVRDKRARLVEPDTHGDDGGRPTFVGHQLTAHEPRQSRPKAPETGSGLHVGAEAHGKPRDWPPTVPKIPQKRFWGTRHIYKPWKAGDMTGK